ncbi:MAG: hypothetical protein FK734_00245 [Asgard group archaeon]|nr:hypothetical protein [Asgard group archaeon]
MALDIIKEQRMIRTLFFSLIESAELLQTSNDLSKKFKISISRYIRERTLLSDLDEDKIANITELLEILGWKSIKIDYNTNDDHGTVILGKNRFFVDEVADIKGTLLVLEAFIEGICAFLIGNPVDAKAEFSFSSTSHYLISFKKKAQLDLGMEERVTAIPKFEKDIANIENLTIEGMLSPIFSKEIPEVILFEVAWKVVTESFIANHPTANDDEIKQILQNPSMMNLSLIIMRLTESHADDEILAMAEIIGEFFAKILSTKVSGSLIERLQGTLSDTKLPNYLIYYECRLFCTDKKFVNRCHFIRGMWIGILSEILGRQLQIKELFHAGKRDKYCMIELIPEES